MRRNKRRNRREGSGRSAALNRSPGRGFCLPGQTRVLLDWTGTWGTTEAPHALIPSVEMGTMEALSCQRNHLERCGATMKLPVSDGPEEQLQNLLSSGPNTGTHRREPEASGPTSNITPIACLKIKPAWRFTGASVFRLYPDFSGDASD